ncbi:gibberellin 2-beta-dioxygenase-like [Trifolium pratense]|uniref:gibberellin 2-beta-dioxygenase-like n=1 Tax=Trifolium pratense TaxID=57577 RepID=UPI001E691108|nr:gibberellin 2-beta-dioxygenase-like [Trifolium pratense]
MVVLSQQATLNELFHINKYKPTNHHHVFKGVPEVDLSHPDAKTQIVNACIEFGFFKVVNHHVSLDLMTNLENETLNFFGQSQIEKEKAGPPDPFGYGSKTIGTKGDVGLVEYLLLSTNPDIVSPKSLQLLQQNTKKFRCAIEDYVVGVKEVCCEVLELIADGLEIKPRNVFSKMVRDEKSDSCLRVNHYPACGELQALSGGNLIGFGEHTDPQIISVLRSNNISGLQICLRDGSSWVSIPPDHTSFFISVGDSLQVMTNGGLKSVKHRVMTDTNMSRLSMIYFGGPPLNEKLVPLPSILVSKEEQSLYKEFTWREYKNAAYKSRLSYNRLSLFEKKTSSLGHAN